MKTDSCLCTGDRGALQALAASQVIATSPHVALDATVLLSGHLEHVHAAAAMSSHYVFSDRQQFGYAYCSQSHSEKAAVGKSAASVLATEECESRRLAILDAVWQRDTHPRWSRRIEGMTLVEREQFRARLIGNAIISMDAPDGSGHMVGPIASIPTGIAPSEISRPLVMIGYFPSLLSALQIAGHTVYCVDDGADMSFPDTLVLEDIISSSTLITTASYLSRPDYVEVQRLAHRAERSVLIAQTCHNMTEYHFSVGFDTVFSESFPPYSLAESTLQCFRRT